MKSKVKINFDNNKLRKTIHNAVDKKLNDINVEIICPNCKTSFIAYNGANRCPRCNADVNLTLNNNI